MKYGCYNREPLRDEIEVQEGWTEDGRRKMVPVLVPLSKGCGYDNRDTDAKCQGCRWQ